MDNFESKMNDLEFIQSFHPEILSFDYVTKLHNRLDSNDLYIHRALNEIIDNKIKCMTELLYEQQIILISYSHTHKSKKKKEENHFHFVMKNQIL